MLENTKWKGILQKFLRRVRTWIKGLFVFEDSGPSENFSMAIYSQSSKKGLKKLSFSCALEQCEES